MVLTLDDFKKFEPVRPTYALFGWPLGHTMSPELHTQLFNAANMDADYLAIAVKPEELETAMTIAKQKLKGINLTIPHKKAVIDLLDAIDPSAMDLHSVNTVQFKDGQAIGYNTDIFGFASTLEKDGVELKNKKTLVIGYGGASTVMAYHCAKSKANLYITGRSLDKAYKLKNELKYSIPNARITVCTRKQIPKDIEIVINGTPLGMYPKEEKKPLYFLPRKTKYVFDAIYNPPKTSTMKLAKRDIKTRNGIYMLVMQAAAAQTIWNNTQFDASVFDSIARRVLGQMSVKRLKEKYNKNNLVLCGFMGSGKTTIGKKLAKLMGLKHIDADIYLEEKENRTITDIFNQDGEKAFRELETKYLKEICQIDGAVISLGGGAVLKPENVEIVKKTGFLIHLDTPFYRIVKNLESSSNRPLLDKRTDRVTEMRKLYNARKHIYRRVSDRSVRSPRLSELVEDLLQSI